MFPPDRHGLPYARVGHSERSPPKTFSKEDVYLLTGSAFHLQLMGLATCALGAEWFDDPVIVLENAVVFYWLVVQLTWREQQ